MYGLWGSKSAPNDTPERSASAAKDPMTSISVGSSSFTHTGSGVPQYRSREIAQSMLFSSHSPKRPVPISGGCQSTRALRASISSLNAVVLTNHDVRA
jgi:hypothetical protein